MGIGYLPGPITADPLDARRVFFNECLLARYSRVWEGLDRAPQTAANSVTLTTYFRWIYRGDWLDKLTYFILAAFPQADLSVYQVLAWLSSFAHGGKMLARDPSLLANLRQMH